MSNETDEFDLSGTMKNAFLEEFFMGDFVEEQIAVMLFWLLSCSEEWLNMWIKLWPTIRESFKAAVLS